VAAAAAQVFDVKTGSWKSWLLQVRGLGGEKGSLDCNYRVDVAIAKITRPAVRPMRAQPPAPRRTLSLGAPHQHYLDTLSSPCVGSGRRRFLVSSEIIICAECVRSNHSARNQ
jgi:hypothetical protein